MAQRGRPPGTVESPRHSVELTPEIAGQVKEALAHGDYARTRKIVNAAIKRGDARKLPSDDFDRRLERIVSEKLGRGLINRFVAKKKKPFVEAAHWLRLILEYGSEEAIARCEPQIQKLRETKWARNTDPHCKLPNKEFLECFIEAHPLPADHAMGRKSRKQAGEEAERQERKRIACEIFKSENEWIVEDNEKRIAKEIAEDSRFSKARISKYHTPALPDTGLLVGLAWEQQPRRLVVRSAWLSLRELNLAMAIPERVIKNIIASLRPRKGEIVKQPIRNRSSTSGTLPYRYGPRLVIGVLNGFLRRLSQFPMDDEGRGRLRKTAIRVKRAFVARLSRSRSIT